MMTKLSKILLTFLAVFLSGTMSKTAQAVPINGSIDFSGTAVGTQAGGTSTLTFNNPMVVTSRTGDYSSVPLGTSANWAPISWTNSGLSNLLTPGPQLQWQFTVAGTTYQLTLIAVTSATMNSSMFTLDGAGIATMSGVINRDPTLYSFFIQGTGNNFVFRIGQPVSDSGSGLAMLAGCAVALELLRRKLLCMPKLE